MFELLTTPIVQGVLAILAVLSLGGGFCIDRLMGGNKDERAIMLNLKGSNVVLWIFFILMFILFFLGPDDVHVFRGFIITSFYISMIPTGFISIYGNFFR